MQTLPIEVCYIAYLVSYTNISSLKLAYSGLELIDGNNIILNLYSYIYIYIVWTIVVIVCDCVVFADFHNPAIWIDTCESMAQMVI